ncbi:hypothetical protein DD237_001252 [Peronospora effusa]|uniref:FYVE-type domain-containing protein n=1 Tax=Peronospora effusa TaxID=542832 RepID=A0A3R7XY94_9STRA|nr:hypothetical protein DD237_001252 [Peronospora effusa]
MSSHLQQQQAAVQGPRTTMQRQRRRRVDIKPSSHKVTLDQGIMLFDPSDLMPSVGLKPALKVELQEDNQDVDTKKEEEEDDDDEGQENQEQDLIIDSDSPAAKQARLRAHVIEEICETEKSYVSDIRALNDHYIVALEEKSHPIMEDAQIAVFFNNLRHLVMLNSKLLTDLQEIMDRPPVSTSWKKHIEKVAANGKRMKSVKSPAAVAVQCEAEGVGAVFCRYAPLFKLYGGYAKDYEEVAALLQTFGRDARLGFSTFLETCRAKSGSLKPFESLLIMPIQRIPRYKLLLERLCELTPPEHPDAAFLTEAVNRIRSAASLINETVRRQENLEIVLQAQQKFSGQLSLFTADRRLLKSGKLTKMSTKRQEDVMMHLFNDILLYSGVLITGGYRVRRIVHLHSKAVGVKTELPASVQALFNQQSRRRAGKDCGFVVTSREKTFVLFTETPEMQREWVEAISCAVTEAQKRKQPIDGEDGDRDGNNPETCEGPADAAALWVPDDVAGSCNICNASFRAYYRRRHHCRRCGTVVCDACSTGRAPLFVGESSRAERVCSPCFKVLDLVRQIALHWLSRVVEFRGVLRRRRFKKWTEHYYELRAGVLKQFSLETALTGATPGDQNSNPPGLNSSGNGGPAVTVSPTNSKTFRCCTDELSLAGAIVIHRSDSRVHKNRFCFQISTAEYDETQSKVKVDTSGQHKASPRRFNQASMWSMNKVSPFKQAVNLFGRRRESVIPLIRPDSSSEMPASMVLPSPVHPAPSSSPTSFSSSANATLHENEWILCATTIQEEVAWRVAVQSSADKALHRMRRSRVTNFPVSLTQSGILSLNISVPQSTIRASMSMISNSSFIGSVERRRLSSLDRCPTTDAELSMELAHAAGEDRDAYLLERRRRHILKEIIRSEKSYVQCLSECIRLFVQPLLLRQLEGRKMHRRRQNKRRGSLRPVLGGPLTASARVTADHRRPASSSNVGASLKRSSGSSNSLHLVLNASYSVAAAASSSLSTTSAPTPTILVMDADLSIFFSSVDQIYTLNQQLLDHLSRHLEETSTTSLLLSQNESGHDKRREAKAHDFSGVRVHRAGAIFHAYAPLMQLYTSYASRHSAALAALDSPQFAGFLRELPPEADVNRLRRYLNMPMERIPRYKMLLQELLGSTPPEHVDFVPLQSAILSVDRVANKIEEISEIRENARTLATVSEKVGIDLSGRHFIRDGMLRKVCRSKVQMYYFVLLEDAMVYGRQGGLHKKFHLLDLWECKVADDTETMPGAITTAMNSNNAFCFYSPLKSFILLTQSEEDKVEWTTDIRKCIDRNLSGKTHPRRTSLRSELLTDNDDDSSSGYELEGGFAIKNGWLNVSGGAVMNGSGDSSTTASSPSMSSNVGKKSRRLWITLTLQTISLGSTFKITQPEETIPIEMCEVIPLTNETCFHLQYLTDTTMRVQTTYIFEALSLGERDEWVRALRHCISGGDELALRRRSLKTATLAPIFMFDKVSNVCTNCTHTFAVYRPRHHCRLCGSLVCGNCSKRRWTLSYSSSKKASRVCDSCAVSAMSITRTYPAERISKSKSHRFSLRKHYYHHSSDADRDAVLNHSTSQNSSHSDKKPRRQPQQLGRGAEQTIVVPSIPAPVDTSTKVLQAPPSNLSSSVRSSSSTLRSTSPTLHENFSCGDNDTEISEESVVTPSQSRGSSMRNSRHSGSTGQSPLCSNRSSLAEYRQLQCSMSYKNRVNSDAFRATSTTSSSSESMLSERMSDIRTSLVDGLRVANRSRRSSGSHSLLNARISESSTEITATISHESYLSPTSATVFSEMATVSDTTTLTEASVAALQTRRAFQQMVLAMEDEDSGDEYDSDGDAWRNSNVGSSHGNSSVVRLSADDYKKFQFRLRQLEELAAEQSRKQADMEQTIEQEVQARTQKTIETMEKQISMYKQAKEFECEREVHRRVSEHLENPRVSRSTSRASTHGLHSSSSVSSFRESYNISTSIKEEGNPLEKLLHPRRSRKRLEQMKEREKNQRREMEQFREFVRTTEMRIAPAQGMDGVLSAAELEMAKLKLDELSDPLLPLSVLQSSPLELIELVCVLCKNGHEQERQIEKAKNLITAAIEAREIAETTAREAVELTLMLDARLDRAMKLMSQAHKFSAANELRDISDSTGSFDRQFGTPALSTSSVFE